LLGFAVRWTPFKLIAKSGNRGAMPIAGPHRLRIDLRKLVRWTND
jgi:hypothetical protein